MSFEKARKESRFIHVPVALEFLIDIMTQGYNSGGTITNVKGIPKDASFEGVYFREPSAVIPAIRTAYFVFCHPSFAKVESDDPNDLPILTPEMSVNMNL